MKFILGKKIEMTQVWQGEKVVAVTKVQTGACVITQVKSETVDGYKAVQVGFGERKAKNISKPQIGHNKGLGNFAKVKEFRIETDDISGLKRGDSINLESFAIGDNIQVTAVSKGKGFQGVVKRHGFHGSKKTHGNKDQERMPGAAGATGPAHVFKGTKGGGRMGNDQVTVKNLEVIEIDFKNKVLYIKGAVPGARNGLVMISGEGDLKVVSAPEVQEVKNEEPTVPAGRQEVKDEKLEEKKSEELKVESEKLEEKKNEVETPEQVEQEVIEAKEKVDEKKSETV